MAVDQPADHIVGITTGLDLISFILVTPEIAERIKQRYGTDRNLPAIRFLLGLCSVLWVFAGASALAGTPWWQRLLLILPCAATVYAVLSFYSMLDRTGGMTERLRGTFLACGVIVFFASRMLGLLE